MNKEWSPLPATVQSCDDPDKPVTTGDKLAPPDSRGRHDMLVQGLVPPKGMNTELSVSRFRCQSALRVKVSNSPAD